MNGFTSLALALLASPLLLACNGEIGDPAGPLPASPGEPLPPFECDPSAQPQPPEELHWKRVRALENDLATALALAPDEVCAEFDTFRCSEVHVVPLGGNDPFDNAQYAPVARPMATTSMAVDRMVLAACANRAALDAEATPAVFVDLVPSDAAIDLADPAISAAVNAQLTVLHRRLLTREPTADEIAILRDLAVDDAGAPVNARELDVLACYAIGTTTEFLFF